MIGSVLKLKGSCGDVIVEPPSAWIGDDDLSTWSILPSVKFWKVAVAVTSNKLMLAVKGFANTKVVVAIPVWTMSVGKNKEAEVIKFWCNAGICTGSRWILDIASFKESIEVLSSEPWMAVSDWTPCR